MDRDESQLIDACLAGDQAAFGRLYKAHAGKVKVYFLRSGFSQADADDMLQETFVRVYISLGTFDAARGAFGQWLSAVARNVTRKRWQQRKPADSLDPELAEDTLPAADDPQAGPDAREEAQALRLCLEALPLELAGLVRLRYVDGLTTRALGSRASIPEATVRLRMSEAKAALMRCLKLKGIME